MYARNAMSYETIFPAICKPLSDSLRCKNCRSRLRCWSDVSPRNNIKLDERNNLSFFRTSYTVKNTTDLMQVVDFTGLMQVAYKCIKPVDFIKLHQVCEHQTCCNLIFANLLQVDETTCGKPSCSSQLAASLLTTCNRLVIIKLEQAMRTHPDIGLDLLQLASFWLCTSQNGPF